MTSPDEPAFPFSIADGMCGTITAYGLTKREYIAIEAMKAALSNPYIMERYGDVDLEIEAYKRADKMLAAGKVGGDAK